MLTVCGVHIGCKKAGGRHPAPSLRHAAGRPGRAPRVAMRILRHSKINVTMEIYTEAPSEATVEALRKLSEQLSA